MGFQTVREIYRNEEKYIDENVKISGWIRTIRGSKAVGFIELNDGTFFKNVQIVYEEKLDNFNDISKFNTGAAISVEGVVIETPNAKQRFEIKAEKIELLAESDNDYPLQKKRHSPEHLRTIAHLRPRSNLFSAVYRVKSLAAHAIHTFFQEKDFIYVHTPIITGSDAEGAGEMFKVTTMDLKNIPMKDDEIDYKKDFFGKETNLTVSGQLEGEAFALAFRKIYTFGPTFRAENSNTTRHAAEFWMMEPEIAFADLDDIMDLSEDMLKYIINYVLEKAPEEMEFFNLFVDKGLLARLQNILDSEFVRISYTEAINILKESGQDFKYDVYWGCDLQTEHERYLTDVVYEKPVFVKDYPKEIKAFYMRENEDNKTVAAMDLLVPGIGELIGGSQREDRIDILERKMKENNLDIDEYGWYLDLRKYGGVTHSGYGLGFERAIMYLTGVSNIRDVIPFPRTVGNAEF